LNLSPSIEDLGAIQWHLVISLFVAWLFVFVVLMRGIKSFGKAVYFTSIFPYPVLLILFIRAMMEPGAIDGIKYYLQPQWHLLKTAKVWGDALTQIFFATSICTGGCIYV
jgi:solute carrier family 6 amino acid transporter-like protein 5/7/9/14